MKPHYPILDGLRGTAAILVVIFHLFEGFFPDMAIHPMHHAYLAVDFFFLLSGFVIGYAYDDRWGSMSIRQFFKIRLIRLHPLVILSVIVGAIVAWFDPYLTASHPHNLLMMLLVLVISFTMIPGPDIRGWNETHSVNGPLWSLFQEYIGNFLYATIGRRLSMPLLWIFVVLFAILLTVVSYHHGNLATGWGYDSFGIGVTRMLFPFFAGLLLFRLHKLVHIPYAYVICSLILLVLFCLPYFGKYTGLYDALVVIFAFPLIVAAGAGGTIKGNWAKICKFSGDISYPLYIIHYPFIYIYTSWIAEDKPAGAKVFPVAAGLLVLFVLLAYGALKLYDEPVRAWLKKKYLNR